MPTQKCQSTRLEEGEPVCLQGADVHNPLPVDDSSGQTPLDEDLVVVPTQVVQDKDSYNNNSNQTQRWQGTDAHADDQRDSTFASLMEWIKYSYSLALLMFSIVVVMTAIFTEQTKATGDNNIHPAFAFIIFWFLICWLAMMEGGQGALVGLRPIDKALYAQSHPRSLMNTTLVHKGDNLDRFVIGRQFLVVLVVFLTNLMASSIKDASVLGLNSGLTEVFLANNVAVMLITIILGQLAGEVNAAHCMLDYVNNYFMLFTTYVSLAIEASGLLHSVYLVQMFFCRIAGKPVASNEPPRSGLQSLLFWARVVMSVVVLGFACAVNIVALFQGQTTMWGSIPAGVSLILFFALTCFVGMMEGLQIALFAVVNLPEQDVQQHPIAYANCKLTFRRRNFQACLIGCQIAVTVGMFLIARITTIDVDTKANEPTIFGVSNGIQKLFNTGLLGAVITTIFASLAWRIVATSFPLPFMSNPLMYISIRVCLLLEFSGICSASWVIAFLNRKLAGFQSDAIYIGAKQQCQAATSIGTNNDDDPVLVDSGDSNERV